VRDIKCAFDNLREETDRPNEVKLRNVKTMPIFTSDDIRKFPQSRQRIQDEMMLAQSDSITASRDEFRDLGYQDDNVRSKNFNS